MRTLQGRVSRIRHTVEVTGNRSRTRTTHIAFFEIAGVRITFGSRDPVSIERGDEVRVVSHAANDEIDIDAVAYYNVSRDRWDDAIGRGGCAFSLGCAGVMMMIPILAVAIIEAQNPIRFVCEFVPLWVPLIALALLWFAMRRDRMQNAEREEVMQALFAQ